MERYFSDLVRFLPQLQQEVLGFAYEAHGDPQVKGLRTVSFGDDGQRLYRKYLGQRRILREHLSSPPDLVVSHCTPSTFPALGHLRNLPLVSHFHGPRHQERAMEGANRLSVSLSKLIERRVFARSSHFITLSGYTQRILQHDYGVDRGKISVIPGGVDLEHFRSEISREEARRRLRIDHHGPVLTAVRRLVHRTGLENLIEAMTDIVADDPEVQLRIVGRGHLEPLLRKQIQERQLGRNVALMGFVEEGELPLIYRASNFTILPSVALEGFGLSSIESLAAGIPVLGTPIGAIPEVLGGLSSSLIFDGDSPSDLAKGIREVLRGERRLPSSRECREYVEHHFSWPVIAKRICSVYEQQVGRSLSTT